ncbi:MAG: kynurenine formamidase [Flammeovirgaceae bacterium]|jgi:kynurenine formamidase
MPEIIDLSQEIFAGMPIYRVLPEVKITMHAYRFPQPHGTGI